MKYDDNARIQALRELRLSILEKIAKELNGNEWNAETLPAIANLVRTAGYVVFETYVCPCCNRKIS